MKDILKEFVASGLKGLLWKKSGTISEGNIGQIFERILNYGFVTESLKEYTERLLIEKNDFKKEVKFYRKTIWRDPVEISEETLKMPL